MEKLPVGEMDNMQPVKPQSRPPVFMYKRHNVFDVRPKFVSRIKISAKKLYKQLKTYEDKKTSCISSLVNFSSDQLMEFLVQTNEPISFGVDHKRFMRLLSLMALGKEVHPILLGETHIMTLPCTPKEINESLLHFKLNNQSGC
ncbi:hypothetical protein MKW98_005194 [Papaver atlanticum]|uniref:Uncharacterized protein n=1 Tax=Papaver atlanticum TaxID=357466 RepID=A0AAD4RWA7_9MAGN|nr:hypothetical protein MKW98_005194 [Papaver atlanticum]